MDGLIDLNRLAALREENPRSLMAYIRFAWPEIRAALDRGHTLKAVHQRLQECGINIGYRHLSSYVGRLRQQDRRSDMPSPPIAGRKAGVAEPPERPAAVRESNPNDPLANVRERTKKRPGFNFSDEPADEEKLI
jgi:hypothetical protein